MPSVPCDGHQNGQQGQFGFVVKEDKTVAVRPVKVSRAARMPSSRPVLKTGETVVTDGQLRLLPGSKIAAK